MPKYKVVVFTNTNDSVDAYVATVILKGIQFIKFIRELFEVKNGDWPLAELDAKFSQHPIVSTSTLSGETFSIRTEKGLEMLSLNGPSLYNTKDNLIILNATKNTLRFEAVPNNYKYISPSQIDVIYLTVRSHFTYLELDGNVYEDKYNHMVYCGPLPFVYGAVIPQKINGRPVTTASEDAMSGIENDVLFIDARHIDAFPAFALTDTEGKHIIMKVILSDKVVLAPNTIGTGTEVEFV